MIAYKSDMQAVRPSAKRIVHVPMDEGEWIVAISDQDYVYQVHIAGSWYYAHEALSSQMLAKLQEVYWSMEP